MGKFYDNIFKTFFTNYQKGSQFKTISSANKYISNEMRSYTPEKIQESIQNSKNNSLSQVNLTECVKELKEYYNITDNTTLVYKKTDFSEQFNEESRKKRVNTTAGQSVTYALYNPLTGQKLDTGICTQIQIKVPLSQKSKFNLNRFPYNYLIKNLSVDVFDIKDPFYIDRCFVYKQNGSDIPLNIRRRDIFPNQTISCGNNCEYRGFDESGNLICNCGNQDKCETEDFFQEFKHNIMKRVDKSNIAIIKCSVR